MSSSSSIYADWLPIEVIRELVSYIADPTSLCRLSVTGRTFYQVIHNNDQIWEGLFRSRWNVNNVESFSKEYERRHVVDKRALQLLQSMARSMDEAEWSNILGRCYESEDWLALRGRDIRSDAYELVLSLAEEPPSENHQKNIVRALAGHAVEAIYHHERMKRWHQRMNDTDVEDVEMLEQGAVLLVESQLHLEDILAGPDAAGRSVVEQLDEIGHEVQRRLDAEGITTNDILGSIHVLNTLLIAEMGFQGNSDNFYDVKNSSIKHVLESRRGIPITLSVLYKFICRRVGIHADVIGLPGHVVVGIPNPAGPLFIDVFRGGRVLTVEDCRAIAASFGFPWRPEFLQPLPARDILSRMINNILNCLMKAVQFSNLVQDEVAYEKMKGWKALAFMATRARDDPKALRFLDTWPQALNLVLDPHIFRRYDVISDDALNELHS